MDVLFDGHEVTLPGRSAPITMGVMSGYDFFGGHAVSVEGFAQDGYCSNTIRRLTDKEVIKHGGDIKDFRSWWEEVLAQLELVADDLLLETIDQFRDLANSVVRHARDVGYINTDHTAAKNVGFKLLCRLHTSSGGDAPVGVRVSAGMLNTSGFEPAPDIRLSGSPW